MAILFNKFPTVAAALLIGLILCSIPTTAIATAGEQLVNVANTNVIGTAAAEYQAFDIGKPLYRIKEQPHVPDLMVENINTISAAPGSAPSQSPSPSPSA